MNGGSEHISLFPTKTISLTDCYVVFIVVMMIIMNMNQLKHAYLLVVVNLFIYTAFGQNTASVSGTIVNRNSLQPLPGITIQIEPGGFRTISDSLGNFRKTGLAPGTYSIQVSAIGFQLKLLSNIILGSGNENNLTIELEPDVQQLNAVVISGRKSTAKVATVESPLSVQRLTIEEIKANPGGNFDVSKVVQSLPGVGGGAAGGSFRNDIIIRGGAPSENVFYLDGIEVPVINHFSTQGSGGGPQGILNVSFIEDVRLNSSAFEARYDNALSSVFQFKQKNGNSSRFQGNIRLSATELAATFDGPLGEKTTFMASARRSYLQLLFKAIDLPIRPNYWDFQFKTNTRLNKKTTLSFLGVGAIDEFSFAAPKNATPEKLYVINSNPLINQWSYTVGATLNILLNNGYFRVSVSRNTLDNSADKFEDNENPSDSTRTLVTRSNETENKLRAEVTNNFNGWKINYGVVGQYIQFNNRYFQVYRPELKDDQGNIIQEGENLSSFTDADFFRYGGFLQAGRKIFNDRLGISAGVRADANTLKNSSSNPLKQLSPRLSISYALKKRWNISASYGIYYRLPSYTQIAFREAGSSAGNLNPASYIRSAHYAGGIEFLPRASTRFTLEGFYKQYGNYPVSIPDGISLANKGTDFGSIGNEPVSDIGKGRVVGFEFFAQQKLSRNFFGVFSYTWYKSEFTGITGLYAPSSWDNRHLLSLTAGYKIKGNWEIGLKFRYQGTAPYTPYDLDQSQLNYLTLGTGIFNYSEVNTLRLKAFHAADIRIDKKWNYKKLTLDLFLDIQNVYNAKTEGVPQYTFKRNADNTDFLTTDGQPIRQDGSNAIPIILSNIDGTILPSIGFIIEF